jgi:hypothetical protein
MFKKVTLPALLLYTFSFIATAQQKILDSTWVRCYGGSAAEAPGFAFSNNGSPQIGFAVAPNGNIYVVTHSLSNDGLVKQNKGDEDIWIVKLTPNGDTIWSKIYGGTGLERAGDIKIFPNGDLVVVGRTKSNNGDFIGNKGDSDGLVMRLDSNGVIKWYRQYGGSGIENLYDVVIIDNNRLVVVGETSSGDGDLTFVPVAQGEAWILILNANNGAIVWQRVTAGPRQPNDSDYLENFWSVVKCADNSGYVAVGTEGHFTFLNTDNIFVVKYSNTGVKLWEKSIGSNDQDWVAQIIEMNNKLYVLGQVRANNGNVSGYIGNGDFWLAILDSAGNILSQRCYGGNGVDDPLGMSITPDNKLLLFGRTQSTNLMASKSSFGGFDAWGVIVEPSNGDTIQTIRFGGSGAEGVHQAIFIPNHLLMVGRTNSLNAYFPDNSGSTDAFIAKFETCYPPAPSITQSADTLFTPFVAGVETYNWYLNGNLISSTNVPFLVVSQAGNYTVETQKGFCVSPLSNSFAVTSLAKNYLAKFVQIYPNPIVAEMTIHTELTATFQVLDITGKNVLPTTTVTAGTHAVNMQQLPSGIYFVRLQTEKGVMTQKVIKK